MNLMQQGLTLLRGRLKQTTVPVLYRRGGVIVNISATPGSSTFEQIDEYGIAEQTVSTDFVIQKDDLILGEENTFPLSGDQVEFNGETYELMAFGTEPCFRYSDPPYNTIFRVHTKEVS